MEEASFSPALFRFLRDLGANNDREWFAANKQRYVEDVQEPAFAFIEDFAPHLHEISPWFRAEPRATGGSLFRIYRDTRFSKDKSPYKTHTGIQFRHEQGKDAHAPGFYLHLEPGSVFAGVGIWHPDRPALTRIRDAIVADPGGWQAATSASPFADELRLTGDSLKRPPAGYDPEHELIDELKRKDFIGVAELDEATAAAAGFLERYTEIARAGAPLVRFLCRALELPF